MSLPNFMRKNQRVQADDLARAIQRLANGDLDGSFHFDGELAAQVAPAIAALQEKLRRDRSELAALRGGLTAAMTAHKAGDIDAQIDAAALTDPYRGIAADINAFVQAHIAVKMQVVDVVRHYARGDFSVDMERLPGKKAQITEVVDAAKQTFKAVSDNAAEAALFIDALSEMSRQHELGWIDEQIAERDFTGSYRRAAELVNTLVRSHIAVKMKVVDVVTKYAHGDFSVEMDRLPGKKAVITEAIDQVRALLPKPDDIASMKRVQAALDNVKTCVMIADAQNNICYMNRSVTAMMREAERDLQRDLPHFRADELMAAKIDQFHKNPSHQTRMLAELRGTHHAEILVGGRTMGLIANPVLDEKGARIGAVVEWTDRTAEVAIEAETTAMVDAAARGDFSRRLSTDGRSGFFRQLAQNMNRLLETCDVGLSEVARVLAALANNDLTETITSDYEGTFGQLKDDANRTVESLTKAVIEIKEAAEIVSSSSREISSGNTDLSQRTEEQASSLEETAASMEQLTSTVRQNAENAKNANELAIGASSIALKGGDVVGEVVKTMAEINASSKKIVDIISVIDGIAFQTNILALNAAVEAARAGEQGRGFAVVAGEVRTLAARSAAAAKEIKQLISDSVENTANGSRLVDEAGSTMAEIVASIKRVTEIMSAIAAASEEQGSGIEQVNESVTQMDKVTQQNAALVEEVAASAEALEEKADSLVQLVTVFTVANGAGQSYAKAAPVHRPRAAARPAAKKPSPAPARKGAAAASNDESDWTTF